MNLDPITQWARTQLQGHPEWVSLRVGHGWDPTNDTTYAWVDIIDQDGHRRCLEPDRFPVITIPVDVSACAVASLPLGQWVDFQ